MKDLVKNVIIVMLYALSLVLAYELDEAEFEIEKARLTWEIQGYLNSEEAKALEKWEKNVRDAINERRVQEAGICGN